MSDDAVGVARQFIDAIAWGEHRKVWDLLSREGRNAVLRVATRRGMDEGLSARLRDSQAAKADEEVFLTDLVNGLRADLAGTDLDSLEFEIDPAPPEPDRTWIMLIAPMNATIGVPGLPVATAELTNVEGSWRVERISPRATTR